MNVLAILHLKVDKAEFILDRIKLVIMNNVIIIPNYNKERIGEV